MNTKLFALLAAAAAFTFASCGENMDGKDGSDANDSVENALQGAAADVKEETNEAIDSAGAKLDRVGERMDGDTTREKMDGDSTRVR